MSTEIERPLIELAGAIRREHDACERDARSAVEHAIRAGELLIDAKAEVSHGEWLPWLDTNFAFTPQTANGYMRLARRREQIEGAPSISVALAELAQPREQKQLTPSNLGERVGTHLQAMDAFNTSMRNGEAPAITFEPDLTAEGRGLINDLCDELVSARAARDARRLMAVQRWASDLQAVWREFAIQAEADYRTVVAAIEELRGER